MVPSDPEREFLVADRTSSTMSIWHPKRRTFHRHAVQGVHGGAHHRRLGFFNVFHPGNLVGSALRDHHERLFGAENLECILHFHRLVHLDGARDQIERAVEAVVLATQRGAVDQIVVEQPEVEQFVLLATHFLQISLANERAVSRGELLQNGIHGQEIADETRLNFQQLLEVLLHANEVFDLIIHEGQGAQGGLHCSEVLVRRVSATTQV
mmetsp:Transcript_40663/g.70369  ORF Transcript_40663/g.70369 Transcript_40663/m.70369 type:complete len:210 (-) Transcript_40663:1897-2526(-)